MAARMHTIKVTDDELKRILQQRKSLKETDLLTTWRKNGVFDKFPEEGFARVRELTDELVEFYSTRCPVTFEDGGHLREVAAQELLGPKRIVRHCAVDGKPVVTLCMMGYYFHHDFFLDDIIPVRKVITWEDVE